MVIVAADYDDDEEACGGIFLSTHRHYIIAYDKSIIHTSGIEHPFNNGIWRGILNEGLAFTQLTTRETNQFQFEQTNSNNNHKKDTSWEAFVYGILDSVTCFSHTHYHDSIMEYFITWSKEAMVVLWWRRKSHPNMYNIMCVM